MIAPFCFWMSVRFRFTVKGGSDIMRRRKVINRLDWRSSGYDDGLSDLRGYISRVRYVCL